MERNKYWTDLIQKVVLDFFFFVGSQIMENMLLIFVFFFLILIVLYPSLPMHLLSNVIEQ